MSSRSSFGWAELILGILLIALGCLTFFSPATAIGSFVVFYGIAAIISGIVDIAFYARLQRGGFGPVSALISGILNILVGILFLLNINIGVLTIGILFPIWFIVHCISRLSNLGFVKRTGGSGSYWITLIVNVLGLIAGCLLLFQPVLASVTLAYIIGALLLLFGIGGIVLAFSRLGQKE